MTLEAFALASREVLDTSEVELRRAVDIAALVSAALQTRGDASTHRLIPGAGLCREDWQLRPTILANRSLLKSEYEGLSPIEEFPILLDILGTILGGWSDDFRELAVLSVAHGARHSAPGSEIMSTTNGCMGPHVRWGSGRQGFMTAGHVAASIGAAVVDARGVSLGTVVWSNDPANAPTNVGDLDAALVSFDPSFSANTGRVSVVAGAGDTLTVSSSGLQADVLGFWDHLRLGGAQACYRQCYATETKITQPGDSGGLVEAHGDVVGMVLGGFVRRDMTIVQSISYQLSEIWQRSGHILQI